MNVMPPPARRQWQLIITSRVVFVFALLWAVSSWTLIMKSMSSLPAPHSTSSLHGSISHSAQAHHAPNNREGARSLEAANDASQQQHLPAPTTPFIYPLHATKGTHHAYLYIGSPPQRQTLIVDTGSRLTAFPCQPHCPDCGTHASEQFNLDKSSSREVATCSSCLLSNSNAADVFVGDGLGGLRGSSNSCYNDRCEIEQAYTEGSSWRAFEVKDKVWLGSNDEKTSVQEHESHAAPFVFGCQVTEEGLFKKQYADGIMGLSMYTQTLAGTFNQNSVANESFSLCFNKVGGHMALGGTVLNHLTPMQFTPFAKKNTWYYSVTVKSIDVGSHKLPRIFMQYMNDYKGTIVDSGTTDTFLPQKIAKHFIKAWEASSGKKFTNSLQLYTYEQFEKLPTVTFELDGGLRWEVEPSMYMEDVGDNTRFSQEPWHGKRGFISRMYVTEPKGAVLGSNVMMGHDIYFDIANRRLGVAKANCV